MPLFFPTDSRITEIETPQEALTCLFPGLSSSGSPVKCLGSMLQGEQGEPGEPGTQGESGVNGEQDTVLYTWKDNGTITVKAGGKVTLPDNAVYTVSQDVDVSFADIDTGTEQASKFYYLWIGTSSGNTVFKLSLSATSPAGLTNAKRLRGGVRNNASSNIIPFRMSNMDMFYDVDATGQAAEVTATSQTISTSFVDVDLSPYVPQGKRLVYYSYGNGGNLYYARMNGSAVTTGIGFYQACLRSIMVDDTGIFEVKQNTSATCIHNVLSYRL